MIRPLALPFLAALAVLAPLVDAQRERRPDRVERTDGRVFEGRVVFEDDARVVVLQGSLEIEIDTNEIESIESLERSLEVALTHLANISARDERGLLDAARLCTTRGLPGEAALIQRLALLADEENEAAHDALEHRRRGTDWTAPLDGKWYPWDKLLELRRDWKRAWEFETTHYRVRTNMPLRRAVDAVLDLERFYLFFYETIGHDLGRHYVLEPMDAWLHGDARSYVGIADREAWYDLDARRLVVDAADRYPRTTLFHEATHQLLDVSSRGKRTSQSAIPAWVDEGLAEYLSRSSTGSPGRAEFRPGQVAVDMVEIHARAEKPYGLTRFLALEHGDFLTSKDAALLYSQAYTLVHMCLHGEDGRWREGFLEFLAACFDGRGSIAQFKKHVSRDLDDLEETWRAYAVDWSSEGEALRSREEAR